MRRQKAKPPVPTSGRWLPRSQSLWVGLKEKKSWHASLAGAAGDRARGGHVGGGQVVGALEFLGEPGRQWHGGPYGAERCVGAGVGGGSGRDDVAAVGVDVDLPGEGAGGAGAGGALPAAGVGLVALLVSYESACNSAVRAPSSTGE